MLWECALQQNKSRPKLIACLCLCLAIQKCCEIWRNITDSYVFANRNVVTRFASYVPTMSTSSFVLRRCHVANRAHVYLAIKCTRGHPFSFSAAALCCCRWCVYFSFLVCSSSVWRLRTCCCCTSLQFTKCELRNVISISDGMHFFVLFRFRNQNVHIARLHHACRAIGFIFLLLLLLALSRWFFFLL